MKIKLTKKVPTKAGFYIAWDKISYNMPNIVKVWHNHDVDATEKGELWVEGEFGANPLRDLDNADTVWSGKLEITGL